MSRVDELINRGKAAKAEKPRSLNGKAPKAPRRLQIVYDAGKKQFWCEVRDGSWIQYSEKSLARILRASDFSKSICDDKGLSLLERELMRIETEECVDWAGELAGYKPGIYEICGKAVLITKGAKTIKARKGPWPTFKKFLKELLGKEAVYFYGWMKTALDSLRAGEPFRPGQALCLAGPANCGKSFLQGVITEVLGGRSADPFQFLTGDTSFNGDLFRAEHLACGDKMGRPDKHTRTSFGAGVKNLLYEISHQCNAKGKEQLTLTPFWRLSVSLNDDAEYITILPPLDGSNRDKYILLKCSRANFPFGADDLYARQRFRGTISAELPAFTAHLRTWKLPKDLADARNGIVHYANLDLAQKLADHEEEFLLLDMIDRSTLFGLDDEYWAGSSEALREFLEQDKGIDTVRRILRYPQAAGKFLGRLAAKENTRVFWVRGPDNSSRWQIFRRGIEITDAKKITS